MREGGNGVKEAMKEGKFEGSEGGGTREAIG